MSTPAQIRASQINGAGSRGPVTSAGREKSSANACKHGLSSTRVVIVGESQEEWDALLSGFTARFDPQGEIEAELVFEMAACLWRLRRAATLETLLLNTEIEKLQNEPESALGPDAVLAVAFTNLMAKSGPLSKLHTHESRLRRRYEKATAELEAIRAAAAGDSPETPPIDEVTAPSRKNEPEPLDLGAVMPELSNTGIIDKLLKLPRVQAILEPPGRPKAA
jgi:hypothetical protein